MRSPRIAENSPVNGIATIEEGKSVELSCMAKGNPEPTITWKRNDGRPLKYIGSDGLVRKCKTD